MKFGSLFAGIGGFDLAFERAGMECAWQVENNKWPVAVLERRWPNVKRYGDVHDVGRHNLAAVDLVCGGFPCQDVSIAGKRKGPAGKRSGLWFEFHRVLEELAPRWVVVENVPGLLSSNGGRDFAVILRGLVEIGYGVCWRVFDAQYSGLAQRRRRVFVVGHLGDGRATEVLFEREGGCWHPPPSREAREGIAGPVAARARAGGFPGTDGAIAGHVIPDPAYALADTSGNRTGSGRDGQDTFVVFDRSTAQVTGAIAGPLRVGGAASEGVSDSKPDFQAIAYAIHENQQAETWLTEYSPQLSGGGGKPGQGYPAVLEIHGGSKRKDRQEGGFYVREMPTTKPLDTEGLNPNCAQGGAVVMAFANVSDGSGARNAKDLAPPLTARRGDPGSVAGGFGVRRLTPVECERLQGFPDGWTGSSLTNVQNCGNITEIVLRRFLLCARNVALRDATGLLLTGKIKSVSCTISGSKNMELRISQIADGNENIQSVGSVTGWLDIMGHAACVQDIISHGSAMVTLCSQNKTYRNAEETLRAIEEQQRESTSTLSWLRLRLEENYSQEKLSTILIWITEITRLLIYTSSPTAVNTCTAIILWNASPENLSSEASFSLTMGTIVSQSDTQRYRQLGNAVAVPVAEWIGQRIIRQHEEKGPRPAP